jgi:hypothetical protein
VVVVSGTWPGFSADWEESSEYQEAKQRARLERTRLADEATVRALRERGERLVARGETGNADQMSLDVAITPAPLPRALREDCPECGMPAESSYREVGGVYFVDRVCPFCEWREIDREGGI